MAPREYIIFPVFLSLYMCTEKVRVQSRAKSVYFLSFFFLFIYVYIYIYTGILLTEIRIAFFFNIALFYFIEEYKKFCVYQFRYIFYICPEVIFAHSISFKINDSIKYNFCTNLLNSFV